jgi:hypothetical protein
MSSGDHARTMVEDATFDYRQEPIPVLGDEEGWGEMK